MKLYTVTFPMADRKQSAPVSAKQLNAITLSIALAMEAGEVPKDLPIIVRTIEADGPLDDDDMIRLLRRGLR